MPTSKGNGQVPVMAEYLAGEFRAAGFPAADISVVPFEGVGDKTASLVVRYRGNGKGGKPILLMAHMDVVAAKREDWERNPFELIEENGFFYGRGTYDVKQGVVAITSTFLRLKAEGFVPTPRPDHLLLRRRGNRAGNHREHRERAPRARRCRVRAQQRWRRRRPRRRHRQAALLLAADRREDLRGLHRDRAQSRRPQLAAARRQCHLRPGRGAPQGARLQVPGDVERHHDGLAQAAGHDDAGRTGRGDCASSPTIRATPRPPRSLRASPSYVGQTRTTCVATMLDGGHGENALPQSARANINCRIFPGVKIEDVRLALQQAAGSGVEVKLVGEPLWSDASPLRPDVVKAVTRAVHKIRPGVPVVPAQTSGATDGLVFRSRRHSDLRRRRQFHEVRGRLLARPQRTPAVCSRSTTA